MPGEMYHGEVHAQRVRHVEGHVSDMILTWERHESCEPPPEDFDESDADISLPLAA
ncbi:MAG TPA: hypothetical protein VMU11_04615 [Verrucomicrobiae bacterium]|nr:hypothetical protein [Verrucomicrobiae bacterium]